MGARSLWLVRHAQPLIAPGVCYGQLDVPADRTLTQSCAEELLKVLPRGTAISTSPLQRCELLAQSIIGLQPDLTVKTDARLQEMHFGQWEGRAWDDIDKAELDDWTDNFADYRAGSTGDSVRQFMARVADAWRELDPARDTLWVTHAGVIRAATLIARGIRHIRRADEWPTQAPAYGQWCKLTLTTHRNHHGHQP
ncbi:MAG: histidine phosphatase family protein [Polaromonas sp.]